MQTSLDYQCSKLYNIVVGVLSLAPCYVGGKQVRGVDQTPYPSQLHGASLATAMQRPCRPLH